MAKYTENGRASAASVVNLKFLEAINSILQESKSVVFQHRAEYRGITLKRAADLRTGAVNPEKYEETAFLGDLSNYVPRYSVTFENDVSVDAEDFEEFTDALEKSPSSPKSLTTEITLPGAFSLNVSCGGYPTTVSYRVSGIQRDVTHYSQMVKQAIANTENDYNWIWSPYIKVAVIISVELIWLYAADKAIIFARTQQNKAVQEIIPSIWCGGLGPIAFLGNEIANSIRMFVPKLDFQWGRASRRRKASRATALWLFSAIALPMVLTFLPVLLNY